MTTTLKNMKFKIDSPEQSAELQKVLFEMGYNWGGTTQGIQFTNMPCLYAESFGGLSFSHLPMFEDAYVAGYEATDTATFIEAHNERKAHNEDNMNEALMRSVARGYTETPALNKYSREIKPGVFVDVYDVLRAFAVTDPCLQHMLKKCLAVGQRGHKDAEEDYADILASAKRAVELHKEWNV